MHVHGGLMIFIEAAVVFSCHLLSSRFHFFQLEKIFNSRLNDVEKNENFKAKAARRRSLTQKLFTNEGGLGSENYLCVVEIAGIIKGVSSSPPRRSNEMRTLN
ncbi:hypothetical protein N7456_000457 [Penicillium angulare]|uniref:Secreted protein n=1 Tax=Penicillium angulare TaxID=116970 RepID=A0A9W9GC66_9EURO|nr:hypothetical protein N7456_000457 [Penicillium angulare]